MIRTGFLARDTIRPRLRGTTMLCCAVALAGVLTGCGFESSGQQTRYADSNRTSAAYQRISLYDAVAISLQRNIDSPIAVAPANADDAPLRRAWMALDSSLAAVAPETAAQERAVEAVIAETRNAYMRAMASAFLEDRVNKGLARLNAALDDPSIAAEDLAEYRAQVQEIEAAYAPFASARHDLARLIGVDNPNVLVLDDMPDAALSPMKTAARDALERDALTRRQEMDALGANTDARIETLIGNAMKSLPTDDGQSETPAEEKWLAFSETFGQGLSRILGMDIALNDPQARTRFEQLRTQAVSTAIIAQVHLAQAQIEKSEHLAQQAAQNASDTLVGSLRAEIARHSAMIALYDAQNLLKRSVGVDAAVAKDLANRSSMRLADLSAALQERDGIAPRHVVTALNTPVYQQADIAPAAFHPVDFYAKIPLAQKIAVQEGAKARISRNSGENARTLKISAGRVKALLDAPIIEP